MISYSLECGLGHEFESLFRDEAGFVKLQRAKALVCPQCGDGDITRNLSAPRLSSSKMKERAQNEIKRAHQQLTKREQAVAELKHYITNYFEDVGVEMPKVVRQMHYGEREEKPVRGQVNGQELVELLDEGIALMPLPDILQTKD